MMALLNGKESRGPRSVVADTSERTRQSASLQCESASFGGPRSVVADVYEGARQSTSLQASRKTPAHHPILSVNNRSPIVFLTVCSYNRLPIFNKPDVHDLLKLSWHMANAWHVGRYVLMPDHIHLFCAPNSLDAPSLERWVHFWKSEASLQCDSATFGGPRSVVDKTCERTRQNASLQCDSATFGGPRSVVAEGAVDRLLTNW